MELQINDLVSAIKKDGIETAAKEAASIIANAKAEAESIITNARSEASKIQAASQKEIRIFEDSAKNNAEQAKRDAVLAFKNEIAKEFEKILSADISKAMNEKSLVQLIKAAIAGEDVSGYAVELHDVTDGLKSELAEEIRKGLEVKVSRNVQNGFRLAAKDGSGYFDCSDEEIKNMLMPFLRNDEF